MDAEEAIEIVNYLNKLLENQITLNSDGYHDVIIPANLYNRIKEATNGMGAAEAEYREFIFTEYRKLTSPYCHEHGFLDVLDVQVRTRKANGVTVVDCPRCPRRNS